MRGRVLAHGLVEPGIERQDDVRGLRRGGDLHGQRIGIQPQSGSFAIVAQRRQNRDDVGFEQGAEAFFIDTLNAAGELKIDAIDHARWMHRERIGDGHGHFESREFRSEIAALPHDGIGGDLDAARLRSS